MSVTVKVNGTSNSVVHKGSMHIAKSTAPDVCKTPSPAGPVPIPYPIIVSMSSDLVKGTTTVKTDGKMAAVKDCEFSMCTGDEPGTAGGVVSSTFKKEAKFILFSFDVKFDGKNVCRLSDKMTMNHQNTVCMSGVLGPPVSVLEVAQEIMEIAKKCQKEVEARNPKPAHCAVRGTLKHSCCKKAMDAKKAKEPEKYRNVHPEKSDGNCRPDVLVTDDAGKPMRIFDYKFNCTGPPRMAPAQRRKYIKKYKCPVSIVGP